MRTSKLRVENNEFELDIAIQGTWQIFVSQLTHFYIDS